MTLIPAQVIEITAQSSQVLEQNIRTLFIFFFTAMQEHSRKVVHYVQVVEFLRKLAYGDQGTVIS